MAETTDPHIAYVLMQEYLKNLRIRKMYMHEKISPFSTYPASKNLFNEIRENKILFGPKIWINSGYTVFLQKNSRRSCIELFEKYVADPEVTYLMGLMGCYSLVYFKKGASILKNAFCIIPSYPEKKSILDIELSEKGEIERDNYPFGWDEIDWKIYHAMRDPTRSFGKVAGELGINWKTTRDRFRKILNQCKIWISFFPFGYTSYQKVFLTFKTDYELNLIEELQKIDRTSFLYKFNSTIMLILFYTDYTELRKFEYLKKEKKIKNLRYSKPVVWENRF